jgi:uroporphyrinogen decarboxylase
MPDNAPNFAGLRVAAFESRRADDMTRLIERMGGRASVSPSMREVARPENPEAVDFAYRLISGQIEVVILLTGVGTKRLVEQIVRHVPRERFLASLSDVTTIVRGPKPTAVMKELGVEPTWRAPEPNTWREVLQTIDLHVPIANLTVAVQEYGQPNASLIAGLEARGAEVRSIKVYDWDFPEDTAPLAENLQRIVAGEIDVALFTSAHQVINMLRLAEQMNLGPALRQQFRRVVVASIGPTTSETLRECELPVDVEPEHSKMGHLVIAAAEQGRRLIEQKHKLAGGNGAAIHAAPKSAAAAPAQGAARSGPWDDGPFMRACRRLPVDRTPVWLMRQAGRYMQEYREVRAKTTFLELCKNPALCAEVMLTAVKRLNVDAAIIFADLLPMLEPMGLDLEFAHGEGPVIHNPIREGADVDRVIELESADSLSFVMETVRLTRADLPPQIPLLGFAGAPFTLASYAIEGGASRSYLHTKTLMYRDAGAWDALMSRLARSVGRYLNAQIEAGAQAVQLFDSWVGCLGTDDYRRYVLPYTRQVIDAIPADVPIVNFATGNPALLPLLSEAGGAVIGIDWRIRLDDAWRAVGHDKAVQGNLDPLVLLAEPAEIRRRAKEILDQAGGRPGHIFNLVHGVLQQTPVDNVIALVEAVRELSARRSE